MSETELPSTLLIVDDDPTFREVLARAMRRRGFEVSTAESPAAALATARTQPHDYAIVDLKMPESSGLTLIPELRRLNGDMRILMLTGFASIATAVEAIKLGACHYLAKPSNTDDIEAAFKKATGDSTIPLTARPTSIKSLEWERIHETLVETEFNVSETARRLGMHRRTLARKLAKRPMN